jgi:PPOX class probable F420-dependent enzyme
VIGEAQLEAFARAQVGRLATVDSDLRPNIVPICFVLESGTLYTAVDHKPKRSRSLKRLENIRGNPAASVLVDHFEADWTRLWWVVAEGRAEVLDGSAEAESAIDLLAAKYAQYRVARPDGPVIALRTATWRSWSAAPDVWSAAP